MSAEAKAAKARRYRWSLRPDRYSPEPPKRRTALARVLVPDLSQPDIEARQRALMRAMVKSAQETTTWGALEYLADLLAEVSA